MNNNNEFKKVSTNGTISTNRRKYFVTSVIVGQRKFSLAIPAEKKPVWDAFKRLAEMERCSAGKLLEKAVEEYVTRHDPGNPQLPLTKFHEFSGVQIPAGPQTFMVRVKRTTDFFGHEVQEDRVLKVSEADLRRLSKDWEDLSPKAKEYWLRILRQIDHPVAHKILEEVKKDEG